jgi:hypothetical protein
MVSAHLRGEPAACGMALHAVIYCPMPAATHLTTQACSWLSAQCWGAEGTWLTQASLAVAALVARLGHWVGNSCQHAMHLQWGTNMPYLCSRFTLCDLREKPGLLHPY